MPLQTILLADDDPLVCALLELRLKQVGYDVHVAADGLAALDALELVKPDVVVLDAMMPRLGGFDVLRRIRGQPRLHRLRVMMLTALRHEGDVVNAMRQGADDYLAKPFSPDELIARIERWAPTRGV
jgi:DNA-binding response OmpR family regulator